MPPLKTKLYKKLRKLIYKNCLEFILVYFKENSLTDFKPLYIEKDLLRNQNGLFLFKITYDESFAFN